MKKMISGIMMTAGLLLFVSCGPMVDAEPIKPIGGATTPTIIVVPTCTPEAVLDPSATSVPQPTVTKAADNAVTLTPVPEPAEEPSVTPTVGIKPTDMPQPTDAIKPTEAPELTLVPTITPEPVETPQVTLTPAPFIDVNMLIDSGWQKTISIDEKYTIVFPGLFRESVVTKEDKDLITKYTCAEENDIEFRIAYLLQQTLEDVENAILSEGGTILEGSLAEKRVVLEWQEAGMVYRIALHEEQYSQNLLGFAFGEEEWITGVMQVVFIYPEEHRANFETTEYSYYIKQNGEE